MCRWQDGSSTLAQIVFHGSGDVESGSSPTTPVPPHTLCATASRGSSSASERPRHPRVTRDDGGVRIRAVVFALLACPGLVLVALPDDGPRLFSLSDAHGPSALDSAGLVLVIAAWLVLLTPAWRRRHLIIRHAGHPLFDLRRRPPRAWDRARCGFGGRRLRRLVGCPCGASGPGTAGGTGGVSSEPIATRRSDHSDGLPSSGEYTTFASPRIG